MSKEEILLEVMTYHSVMWRLPPVQGQRVLALCACHSRVDYPVHILEELNKKLEEKILDGTYPVVWGIRYSPVVGGEEMSRHIEMDSFDEASRKAQDWTLVGVKCKVIYRDASDGWTDWSHRLTKLPLIEKKVNNEV